MRSANGHGSAGDSEVDTGEVPAFAEARKRHEYLIALADDAEAAVTVIEEKLEGMKAALAAKKAEAKQARAATDAVVKE